MRAAFALLLVLQTSAAIADCPDQRVTYERISLVALLANPAAHSGKYVSVQGFLHLEFEGDRIYLHKEDYREQILSNAIALSIAVDSRIKKLQHGYVHIEGRFSYEGVNPDVFLSSQGLLSVCSIEK